MRDLLDGSLRPGVTLVSDLDARLPVIVADSWSRLEQVT